MALLAASTEVSGHAIITATSLREHPIDTGQATHVLLVFNSSLEIALSRVFLVSKGDHYQQLHLDTGPKAGQLMVEVPALAAGDYALKYRILAADGHVTEDVIRFHVGR
jgi:methionine-rich copper-binding protein CopC